jgi:polysaccharide pyruvyl transferase WcaK-like protein
LQKFAKILKERNIDFEIYQNLSIDNTIEEISKLEYLIGMRFHANLVAAKSGVKVLGINYDVKVMNLAKYVGFPIINLNDDDFNSKFGFQVSVKKKLNNIRLISMG